MTSTLTRPTGAPRSLPSRARGVAAGWASRSTPALLRAARLVVVLLLAVTGAIGVVSAGARDAAVTAVTTRIEPLNADAATVYRALADADATVVSGYLSGGDESTAARQRYDDDIAAAASGLAAAAGRADDPATADRVAELARQLPVYAGLIEQARANNRQGLPVGASYLGRASDLMQGTLLPVAESLQERQARKLSATFAEAGALPITALLLTVVALAALVALQVWHAVRFRRVLNAGMVAATVVVLAALGWAAVAGGTAGGHLATSQAHGRAVSEALVPAQIAALQARAAEGLALVRRAGGTSEQAFDDRMQRLARDNSRGGALGAAGRLVLDPTAQARLADAVAATAAYRSAHDRVHDDDAAGRYPDAVRLAVGAGQDGATTAFEQLDGALVAAVDAERAAFAREMAAAQAWRTGLAIGTGVLALAAAVAVAFGLSRRLEGYR
jgi:hypothetical protein